MTNFSQSEDMENANCSESEEEERNIDDPPLKKMKYEEISTNNTKSKKSKKDLYKQPSAEELNELKETENLYNNNLFRLQIEELISAIQIKPKYKQKLDKWFIEFQNFLSSLPQQEFTLSDLENKKGHKNFLSKIRKNTNMSFTCDQDIRINFTKPESFQLFGLYELNSAVGPKIDVDINLIISRDYFHLKDYLNNRYFTKRYYYMVYIAEQLKVSKICKNINFEYFKDNLLLPILHVTPNTFDKIGVKIFVTPPEQYFKPPRCLPDVNNVKCNVFKELLSVKNTDLLKTLPTPSYNSVLAFDVTLFENNSYIKNIISELPNVQEGIKLITVWLNQRGLNVGLGSFTVDLIIYIIVFLILKRRINKHMSSYQVTRHFWNILSVTDLINNPISICENVNSEVISKFKQFYDVIILDVTGCFNVAAFLSLDVYLKVKNECQLALKLLEDNKLNSFSHLFLTKIPFELQYDVILDVKAESNYKDLIKTTEDTEKAKYLGDHVSLIIKKIQTVLKFGLNKRSIFNVPYVKFTNSWEYGISNNIVNPRILFGISLNLDNAFNFIEHGPVLNDPKENEFKEFWGTLTSNRRFRDGTARVAVVFDTNTIKSKREIIKTILNLVLSEKLCLDYKIFYDEFEEVLVNKRIKSWYPIGTNEETTLKITFAADDLGKKIRSLQMSLSITSIQGISDIFCYTNIFPPIPTTYKSGKTVTSLQGHNVILNETKLGVVPKYVQPIESVIYLEHSSKWPKDLEPLRCMKIAFYLEISKLLKKHHKIISTVKDSCIDIFYQGLVFRYTIYLPKEIGLLKREVVRNGIVIYKDSKQTVGMEMKLNVMPKIVGGLKGIQSQYPSYGVSTSLAKRWIRTHLVDDYLFPDIVINLLNAYYYVNNSPYLPPMSPQSAFLRFLKFVAETEWNLQVVIVNFNDELSKEAIVDIESKVQTNREKYPPLYLVTPWDNGESIFTKTAPSKEILNCVKNLASATLKYVENIVIKESLFSIKELFIPSWEGYNAIIHLKQLINPRRHEQVLTTNLESVIDYKEFNEKESKVIPVIDFNPVSLYLQELRENYAAFCTFFHDSYGGNSIGVLWKPDALEPKDFKVANIGGRKLVEDKLILNIDAMIEDFYLLGKGLVRTIVIQ